MNKTVSTLMKLIKSTLLGDTASLSPLTEQEATTLYRLSSKQDVAHLVGDAVCKGNLLEGGELYTAYQKSTLSALYRYNRLSSALALVCRLFEEAKIPFMPLKGSVIRALYPAPWMRMSCDVDILVHEEDLACAKELLLANSFRSDIDGSHDISFFSPSGVHIELHFRLMEDHIATGMDLPLADPWAHAAPKSEGSFHYVMSDALFYYYHMAHMAKHYLHGGCGIRPFIDLYILSRQQPSDSSLQKELLAMGGLTQFAEAAEALTAVWFADAEASATTEKMEEYLIKGGVYGSKKNRVAIQQAKRGGKLGYALSRIFLPYEILKFYYPVLQKHKWLLPACEVIRWVKLLFSGGLRRSADELRMNQAIESKSKEDTANHLKSLGLG